MKYKLPRRQTAAPQVALKTFPQPTILNQPPLQQRQLPPQQLAPPQQFPPPQRAVLPPPPLQKVARLTAAQSMSRSQSQSQSQTNGFVDEEYDDDDLEERNYLDYLIVILVTILLLGVLYYFKQNESATESPPPSSPPPTSSPPSPPVLPPATVVIAPPTLKPSVKSDQLQSIKHDQLINYIKWEFFLVLSILLLLIILFAWVKFKKTFSYKSLIISLMYVAQKFDKKLSFKTTKKIFFIVVGLGIALALYYFLSVVVALGRTNPTDTSSMTAIFETRKQFLTLLSIGAVLFLGVLLKVSSQQHWCIIIPTWFFFILIMYSFHSFISSCFEDTLKPTKTISEEIILNYTRFSNLLSWVSFIFQIILGLCMISVLFIAGYGKDRLTSFVKDMDNHQRYVWMAGLVAVISLIWYFNSIIQDIIQNVTEVLNLIGSVYTSASEAMSKASSSTSSSFVIDTLKLSWVKFLYDFYLGDSLAKNSDALKQQLNAKLDKVQKSISENKSIESIENLTAEQTAKLQYHVNQLDENSKQVVGSFIQQVKNVVATGKLVPEYVKSFVDQTYDKDTLETVYTMGPDFQLSKRRIIELTILMFMAIVAFILYCFIPATKQFLFAGIGYFVWCAGLVIFSFMIPSIGIEMVFRNTSSFISDLYIKILYHPLGLSWFLFFLVDRMYRSHELWKELETRTESAIQFASTLQDQSKKADLTAEGADLLSNLKKNSSWFSLFVTGSYLAAQSEVNKYNTKVQNDQDKQMIIIMSKYQSDKDKVTFLKDKVTFLKEAKFEKLDQLENLEKDLFPYDVMKTEKYKEFTTLVDKYIKNFKESYETIPWNVDRDCELLTEMLNIGIYTEEDGIEHAIEAKIKKVA